MKNKLNITDSIYGKVTITSEVLIELIESPLMQRLKGIDQLFPNKYYYLQNCSRYDHSVGVMILLHKLGASEEEQIAGLLHDASHTAFSHVIDWLLKNHLTEDFQDKRHSSVIETSEVAKILKKYKYDPKRISNYKNFTLLEQDLPNICADRFDYALRDFMAPIEILKCSKNVINHNEQIVFTNKNDAFTFAKYYLWKQKEIWGGFESISRYDIFSKMLAYCLEKKIIQFEDFYQDDKFVLSKLENTKDNLIEQTLNTLRKKSLAQLKKSKKGFTTKFRRVDPLILINKELINLSKINPEFEEMLIKAQETNNTVIYPAILD